MEKEKGDDIVKKNNEYVFQMQVTKSMLLDLFLAKELSEWDLKIMMDDLQEWYKKFIKSLTPKPDDGWQTWDVKSDTVS